MDNQDSSTILKMDFQGPVGEFRRRPKSEHFRTRLPRHTCILGYFLVLSRYMLGCILSSVC